MQIILAKAVLTEQTMTNTKRQKNNPLDRHSGRFLFSSVACLFSLLSAIVISLLLTLYPQAVIDNGEAPNHWALMICMLGITGGYVHGVGFVPKNRFARLLFSPLIAWSFMFGGIILMSYQ